MGDERMRVFRAVLAIAALAVVFSAATASSEEGDPPSSCCGTLFDNQTEAAEHMIEHHGKKGCVSCAKLFENDEEAKEHARGHGHTS
jgi:hypothetical protein